MLTDREREEILRGLGAEPEYGLVGANDEEEREAWRACREAMAEVRRIALEGKRAAARRDRRACQELLAQAEEASRLYNERQQAYFRLRVRARLPRP